MSLLSTLRAPFDRVTARVVWLPGLLVRVVLGVTFILTGWGKLQNLDGVIKFFDSLGIPAASVQAPMVAGIEFVGGMLILAGLGTRIAAALLSGVMTVAIATAIWPKSSITNVLGSIEAIYLASFVALMIGGAGPISLDRLLVHYVPALRSGESAGRDARVSS